MVSKLIMLVEDDDSIRLMARRIIEHSGYQVEDYAHGLSAFKRLIELNASGEPDKYRMILSDIDMPKMDGLMLAEECAKVAANTPFVLMTGRSRGEYPTNVKEVLLKPFGPGEYKRVLDKYAARV